MNRLLTGDDGGTDTRPALCRVRVHIEQHQPRQVVFDMDTCSKPATYRICRAPQQIKSPTITKPKDCVMNEQNQGLFNPSLPAEFDHVNF